MTAKRKPSGKKDRQLTAILDNIGPEFIEQGSKKIGPDDVRKVVASAEEIWTRFADGEALARFRREAELMISLLLDYQAGRYRGIPYWPIAVIAFTLQYVLKPIDIIPDSLPVIGQLDDAMVVAHGATLVERDLHSYKIWRLAHETDSTDRSEVSRD